MFTIALSWPVNEDVLRKLYGYVSDTCRIISPNSHNIDDLLSIAADADAIVGGYIPEKMIENAPNVRLIQTLHSGVTHRSLDGSDLGFSFNTLRARGILLSNVAGANAVAVAELAFALTIALAKRILPAHRAISQGDWYPYTRETMGCELAGKTMGIVGLGAIGVELARRAKAFGMTVLATKRTLSPDLARKFDLDFLGAPEDLHHLLQESDFVELCIPWMPTTDKLINEDALKLMKPTSYLVNIARARIVDEDALYKALTENWIAGFGTDVWWDYDMMPEPGDAVPFIHWGVANPIVSRMGIHKLDNVVITGDRAAFNPETLENFLKVGLQNVDAFAQGLTPPNLVDLSSQA